MSNFQVTDSTVDVITRGLIKYRLITHASADTIGADIKRVNHAAVLADPDSAASPDYDAAYERRPFERKVKRMALHGAILCWQYQVSNLPGVTELPVYRLVQRLYDKNLGKIQQAQPNFDPAAEPAEGEVTYWDVPESDEGRASVMIPSREQREEANQARLAERMAALQAERAANPQSSEDEDMDDESEWEEDDEEGDDDA